MKFWPAAGLKLNKTGRTLKKHDLDFTKKPLNRISNALILLLSAVLFVLMTGCSASGELMLNEDLSGTAYIDLSISQVLTRYYQDITGEYDVDSLVNRDALAGQLAQRPGLDLTGYEDISSGEKRITLKFSNINELIRQEMGDAQANISFIEEQSLAGGRKKIILHLDEHTIPVLLSLGPVSSNVLSDYLLPPDGSEGDAASYRDDLLWALEDYAPADELKKLIDGSGISIIIPLSSKPLDIQGGRALSADELAKLENPPAYAVEFSANLTELLTLSTPGEFSVIY